MCEDKWLVDRDQGCPVVSARPGVCVYLSVERSHEDAGRERCRHGPERSAR